MIWLAQRDRKYYKKGIKERNKQIINLLVHPPYLNFTEVSQKYGMTRERVRQILKEETGLTSQDITKKRKAFKNREREKIRREKIEFLISNPKIAEGLVYNLFVKKRLFPSEVAEKLQITYSDLRKKIAPFLSFPINRRPSKLLLRLITESKKAEITLKEYLKKIYLKDNMTYRELTRSHGGNPSTLSRILVYYNIRKRLDLTPKGSSLKKIKKFAESKGYSDLESFFKDMAIVPPHQLARIIGVKARALSVHRNKFIKTRNIFRWYSKHFWFTDKEVKNCSLFELEEIKKRKE